MFSLKGTILLKVLLAVMLLVYLQFGFVNPWLDVLKEDHLCITDAEDRLTSLAPCVCCAAEQGQLCSFPCLLIQHSRYHSNTTRFHNESKKRSSVVFIFLFAMVAVTP